MSAYSDVRNRIKDRGIETTYSMVKDKVKNGGVEFADINEDYINSFTNDMNKFFTDADASYKANNYANAKSNASAYSDRWSALNDRSKYLLAYANLHKNGENASSIEELSSYINDIRSSAARYLDAFKESDKYYSQFKNENEYNAYNDYGQFSQYIGVDSDELASEIEKLKDARHKASELSGQKDSLMLLDYEKGFRRAGYSNADVKAKAKEVYDRNQIRNAEIDKQIADLFEGTGYEYDGINSVIDSKEQLLNQAKHIQGVYDTEERVLNSDDFARTSYETLVNEDNSKYMSERQKSVYNYLLVQEKNGLVKEGSAEDYKDSIKFLTNEKEAEEDFQNYDDNTFKEILFGVKAGLVQFGKGMANLVSFNKDYIAPTETEYLSGMIREDLGDRSAIARTTYDTINTIANMIPSILASAGSELLLPGSGAIVGTSLMGASAAGNTYAENLNSGKSGVESYVAGVVQGTWEGLSEYYLGAIEGIGGKKLSQIVGRTGFGKALSSSANGLVRGLSKVADFGIDAVNEGLEEVIQDIGSSVLNGVMTDEWEWSSIEDQVYNFTLGALSAGVLNGTISGINGATNTIGNIRTARDIKNNGRINDLVEAGNTFSADTVVSKILPQINENTSVLKLSSLLNSVKANLSDQNKADISYLLEQKGMSKTDAEDIAEWLGASVLGYKFNRSQRKALENNKAIQEAYREVIVNQNSTVNQRLSKLAKASTGANIKYGVDADYLDSEQYKQDSKNYTEKNAEYLIARDMSKANQYREVLTKEQKSAVENVAKDIKENMPITDSEDTIKSIKDRASQNISSDNSARLKGSNESITIKKIKSLKNGRMELELADGRIVNAREVNYANEDQAFLYEFVKGKGYSVGSANAIINGYNALSDADVLNYALGINEAYTYGKMNYTGISREGFSAELTERQRKFAFDLGRNDAEINVNSRERKLDTQKKEGTAEKSGKVHITASVTNLSRQRVSLETIGKVVESITHNDVYIFESVSKDGKRVLAEDIAGHKKGENAPNGFFDSRTGAIYLDLYAGANGEGVMLYTFAHELTHYIRRWSPSKFKTLADFVMSEFGKKGVSVDELIDAQMQKAENRGRKLTFDQAYEEVIADSMESILTNTDAVARMQKLKAKDSGLWDKIKQFFRELYLRIKAEYRKLSPQTREGIIVSQMKDSLDKMSKLFSDAVVSAGESFNEIEFTEQEKKAYFEDKNILMQERFKDEHKKLLAKKYDKANASIDYDELIKRYDKILKIWSDLGGELNSKFLNDWNNQESRDRAFTIFKSQQGYKYNAELSSMCRKGIPLFEAIDMIVKKEVTKQLKSKTIGTAEKQILYDILKTKSFQIPCAICYVEQARQREGSIINAFVFGKTETNKSGKVTKRKLGWNQVLDLVETRMHEKGSDFKFENFSRDIATDNYSAESINMDAETEKIFYDSLKEVCNEEIEMLNRENSSNRSKIKGTTPKAVNSVLKGTLPKNLKIFKVLFNEKDSRMRLEADLLYSSMTTRNLSMSHNELYSLFNSQSGVNGYKTKQGTVAYMGDILKKNWKSENTRGDSVRTQSNSDFMMYTLLDMAQMYIDMSAKGYYLHAYTKVLSELKLFGLSNSKINASLIPAVFSYIVDEKINSELTQNYAGLAYVNENGQIDSELTRKYMKEGRLDKLVPIYDDVEGIEHSEAFMIVSDPEYSKNVGCICIGYSDNHILKLLDDNRVQEIIGFHDKTNNGEKRYRGAKFAKNYNGLNEAQIVKKDGSTETKHINFTSFILDAEKKFNKISDGVFEGVARYNGNVYSVDDIPKLAADMYLDYCSKNKMIPAYHIEIGEDADGNTIYMSDHPNYYKLLADYSLKNSEGHYAPHKKVEFNMPESVPYLDGKEVRYTETREYIRKELEAELRVRDDIANALADTSEEGIIPQFIKKSNELYDQTNESDESSEMLSDRADVELGTLFTGAGTFEYPINGLIHIQYAAENRPEIVRAYKLNHGGTVFEDVMDIDIDKMPNVQYLHVSPPCVNFSGMNNNVGEKPIDRKLARKVSEIIMAKRPRAISIENVSGYATSDSMNIIREALRRAGYKDVDIATYTDSKIGGYTTRTRVILRAMRDENLPKVRKGTIKNGWGDAVGMDFIESLPDAKKVNPRMIESLKTYNGIDVKKINRPLLVFGESYKNKTFGHAYYDQMCPTIFAKTGASKIFLPNGTVKECTPIVLAKIMGVDGFKLPKDVTTARRVIGNGIPASITQNIMGPVIETIKADNEERLANGEDIMYSERETDPLDNRSLLSNALESVAKTEAEKKMLAEYKSKITSINEDQNRLSEIGRKIRELTFTKGKRDTEEIARLRKESTSLSNRINSFDRQLLTLEASKPLKDVLTREKASAEKRIKETSAEAFGEYKEKTAGREYIKRIEEITAGLEDRLLHPSSKTAIPELFAKSVTKILKGLDFTTFTKDGSARRGKANITRAELRSAISELSKSLEENSIESLYGQLDISPDMKNWLEQISAYLDNEFDTENQGTIYVRKLNLKELQALYKMLKNLRTTINNESHMYTIKSSNASGLAKETIDFLKPLYGKGYNPMLQNAGKPFEWDFAQPITVFDRFGNAGQTIFKSLLKGQKQQYENLKKIQEFVENAYTKEEVNTWRKQKQTIKVGGKDETVTTAYLMELHASLKDKDAQRHILDGGGIRFSDLELGTKGERFTDTFVTKDEIDAIEKLLDTIPRAKEVAESLQQFLAETGADWGNAISMIRFGYKAFGIKDYYPIRTIKGGSDYEARQKRANIYALLNKSFTKERQTGANNTIIIGDIFNTFNEHMTEMALYNAWALPVIDTIKWFKYRESMNIETQKSEVSVNEALRQAYGKNAIEYIERLLESINSQKSNGLAEDTPLKLMRIVNRVAIPGNIRVAIQQPFSVVRALELINIKYVKPLFGKAKKQAHDEMIEHSSLGGWKSMGYYDINVSRPFQKIVFKDETFVDKASDKLMFLAEEGDDITWSALWNACKTEAIEKNKGKELSEEELMRITAERFDDIIVRTQVVDSVLTKNQWMRSDKWYHRMTSAFMSEPMTSYNTLLRRYNEFNLDKARSGFKEAFKKNGKKIALTVTVFTMTQLVNAIVTAPIDAMRDDDDYKTYLQKLLENFRQTFIQNMLPTSMMPMLNDVADYIMYEKTDRPDMQLLVKTVDLGKQIYKTISDYDYFKLHKLVKSSVEMASSLSGLPMGNIMRDALSIWNTTVGSAGNGELKFQTSETSSKIGYDLLYDALTDGNDDRAISLISQLQSNLVGESAIRSAMRERMKDEYLNGDITKDEADAIIRKLSAFIGEEYDENETYWQLDRWEYESENGSSEGYTKYDDFFESVGSGKNLKETISKYTQNGVDEKTLASQITSHFKPIYKEMSAKDRANLKGYLLNAYVLLGYDRAKKSKDIDRWSE